MTGKKAHQRLVHSLKKLSGITVAGSEGARDTSDGDSIADRLNASRAAAQKQREMAQGRPDASVEAHLWAAHARTFDEEESRLQLIAHQRRAVAGVGARVPGPSAPQSWIRYEGTFGIAPGASPSASSANSPASRDKGGVRIILNGEPVLVHTTAADSFPTLLELCAFVVGTTLVHPVASDDDVINRSRIAKRIKKKAKRKQKKLVMARLEASPCAMELDVAEEAVVASAPAPLPASAEGVMGMEAMLRLERRYAEATLGCLALMPWDVRRTILKYASSVGRIDDSNMHAFALHSGESARAVDLTGCNLSNVGVLVAIGYLRRDADGGYSHTPISHPDKLGKHFTKLKTETADSTWEDIYFGRDCEDAYTTEGNAIVSMPSLRVLDLNLTGCKLVSGGSRFVGDIARSCPSLRKLTLAGCLGELTGPTTVAAIVSGLQTLEVIDLSGCVWLGDAEVRRLRHMPRLRKVIAKGCPLVTSGALLVGASSGEGAMLLQ